VRRILAASLPLVAVLLGLTVPVAADPNTATLTASPNPATVGGTVEFAGCGYDPGGVTIVAYGPEAISWFGGPVDDQGCIDVVWLNFAAAAGTYQVGAYEEQVTGQTVHQRLQAETTLVVGG